TGPPTAAATVLSCATPSVREWTATPGPAASSAWPLLLESACRGCTRTSAAHLRDHHARLRGQPTRLPDRRPPRRPPHHHPRRPGTQEPRSPPQLHPRRLHGLRHLNLETSDSAEHRDVRNPVTCGPWGGRHSGSGVETSLVSNRWLAESPTTYGACAS